MHRWAELERNVTSARGAQTSCAGAVAAAPVIGLTVSQCAEACDRLAPASADNHCVAFSHYAFEGLADVPPASESWYGPLSAVASYQARNLLTAPGADSLAVPGAYPYYYSPGARQNMLDSADEPNRTEAYYEAQAGAVAHYYYYEAVNGYYYRATEFAHDGGGELFVYPLCFLLREVGEVVEYDCAFGEEWKDCTDEPRDWHEAGRKAINCEWHAYSPEFCPRELYRGYDGTFAKQACCACGGGAWTDGPGADAAVHGFLRAMSAARAARSSRAPGGVDLPLPLVQNRCMARFAWALQGHEEPEHQQLRRCFGEQREGTAVDVLHDVETAER